MIRRSWVIRAVPAAAMSSAPPMMASSSATASDRRRWAPRKLMLTALAFWMTKITTTMRMAMPAISALYMLLILVRSGLRGGACGRDCAGGAVPLADGSGRALGALVGAAGAVMTVFLQSGDRSRFPATLGCWPPTAADSQGLFSPYAGNRKLAIYF